MPPSPGRFGLSCALTTPFRADMAIDLPRLVGHARWCLDQGCSSVTVFGTTGEGASIGMADREQVLGALAGAGLDPTREVVAGIAAASLGDALSQARMALALPCRALLVAPPFYFKGVADDGVYAWFARLIEGLGDGARDLILYNIPSVTQVTFSLDLIERLKTDFPEAILGVKDSSGDWSYGEALLEAHGELAILIGDERLLARGVRLGSQGTICGVANFWPQALVPMVESGRDDPRVAELLEEVLKYPVTPAIKALVAHQARDEAWLATRPPLQGLTPADAAQLGRTYDRMLAAEAA